MFDNRARIKFDFNVGPYLVITAKHDKYLYTNSKFYEDIQDARLKGKDDLFPIFVYQFSNYYRCFALADKEEFNLLDNGDIFKYDHLNEGGI